MHKRALLTTDSEVLAPPPVNSTPVSGVSGGSSLNTPSAQNMTAKLNAASSLNMKSSRPVQASPELMKQSMLEEVYNAAFEDELEKIALSSKTLESAGRKAAKKFVGLMNENSMIRLGKPRSNAKKILSNLNKEIDYSMGKNLPPEAFGTTYGSKKELRNVVEGFFDDIRSQREINAALKKKLLNK